MREKAEQGIYPSRPSLGYRNNKVERTIEIEPSRAPIARRMFELYASGRFSLELVWKMLKQEFDVKLSKSHVEKLLKNPFYAGSFYWDGRLYPGTHEPLISRDLFDQVQAVFRGHHQPKYQKREFAFGGLLQCAYDDCTVTAEIKKNRYTYYHCTGYRGKCALPYFREEELGDRLGHILKDIHIPDDVSRNWSMHYASIVGALRSIESPRARGCGIDWHTCATAWNRPTSTNWTGKSPKHSGKRRLRNGTRKSNRFEWRSTGSSNRAPTGSWMLSGF
jgi:hypothetical protein